MSNRHDRDKAWQVVRLEQKLSDARFTVALMAAMALVFAIGMARATARSAAEYRKRIVCEAVRRLPAEATPAGKERGE